MSWSRRLLLHSRHSMFLLYGTYCFSKCAVFSVVSCLWALVAQIVKNLPAVWETWVRSLGGEDSLEEGVATHSSILAWRITMDRGASSVHQVTKSQTQLRN